MLEMKNVGNITFIPSPVDIWRRLQRNVSFSSGEDAVFDTFIPLFIDENVLGTSYSSEIPGLDSNEESSSTDNYDDIHSSEDSDSESIGIPVTETNTKEKSSILKDNDAESNSKKIAGYPGVDVSEDVFYLLEKWQL